VVSFELRVASRELLETRSSQLETRNSKLETPPHARVQYINIIKHYSMKAKLTSIGIYAPERVVDNHYFEQVIDTTDEWIQSRTGIRTRRYAAEGEYTSDLAIQAVRNMAAEYNLQLDDVDFILVATVTPD